VRDTGQRGLAMHGLVATAHLFPWSIERWKHGWQKVCPQGVVTGRHRSLKQRMQSNSSSSRETLLQRAEPCSRIFMIRACRRM
jgi:hypothetical protein